MNLKEIEALLEKFYDGESSLEEEESLRKYFNQEIVPDHLSAHLELFRYYKNARDEKIPLRKIEYDTADMIRKDDHDKNHFKKRRMFYLVTGIAASILILIGVYFQFIVNNKKSKYQLENTYEDPEVAYAEAKKALLLVSEKLNAGVQDFNKFSTFSQYQELITRKN